MGSSFHVSWPVMRASIAAASATAQGEGSGGQDKTLRRLWVSQAGWDKSASPEQHACWLRRTVESRDGAAKTGWSSRFGGRYLVIRLGMGNE